MKSAKMLASTSLALLAFFVHDAPAARESTADRERAKRRAERAAEREKARQSQALYDKPQTYYEQKIKGRYAIATADPFPIREWRSKTGSTVEASLSEVGKSRLTLETKDGKKLQIARGALSDADHAYLNSIRGALPVERAFAKSGNMLSVIDDRRLLLSQSKITTYAVGFQIKQGPSVRRMSPCCCVRSNSSSVARFLNGGAGC
jgi:hypothetical protein